MRETTHRASYGCFQHWPGVACPRKSGDVQRRHQMHRQVLRKGSPALALCAIVSLPAMACSVTAQPEGGMLRNEALEVPIMPEGTITFGAKRAGFRLPDGSLMIKYGWVRLKPGAFSIQGRR